MNKKGNIGLVLMIFVIVAIILCAGLFIAIGGGVIKYTFNQIAPEISSLGQIGDTNMTQVSSYTITPLGTVINSFTWLGGVIYAMLIIGLFGFAISFKVTANKIYMFLFFMLAVLIIILSIFISNIYQDFYTGTEDTAVMLQEQTLMSFLMIHSPMIFTVVIFVAGIIIFSGINQEDMV